VVQGRSLAVEPARRVHGTLRVPGDKSISHRYVMLAAIARGLSTVNNLAPGADVASTIACFERLGVAISRRGPGDFEIAGRGWTGLTTPADVLDAGNSGTTLRLLTGLLAGRPIRASLTGDASLRRRPMSRVVTPLQAMGARIQSDNGRAPLTIDGTALTGIAWRPEVPSAQIKSALMLAGLSASGRTVVTEPAPTRDHSERAFPVFGLRVETAGASVAVPGGQEAVAAGTPLRIPGDPSSAAVWAAAAAGLPGSVVQLDDVLLNPRRLGFVNALRGMGAEVDIVDAAISAGEPVGEGLDLNGERFGDGPRSEHLDQWFTHAEIGKGLVCSNFWGLSASGVPSRGEGTRGRSAQGGEIAGGQYRSPRYELCWRTNHLNRCFSQEK